MVKKEQKNSKELVSIIMPAYNAEKFIGESIESVLVQTWKNWELIIVDDGSVDNTSQIIKNYAMRDERIKYFFQENQKQGRARNYGIKHSNGEYVAFLDSDDLWVPDKLEIQVEFFRKSGADLIFSDGYIFSDNPVQTSGSFNTLTGLYRGDEAIVLFLKQNRIPILSVLTRMKVLEEVGGFSEERELQNIEDYHLWLRILLKGYSVYGMKEKLVYYRRHGSQVTMGDPISSEKVLNMFGKLISVPSRLNRALDKAKLICVKNIYLFTATDKQLALKILRHNRGIKHLKIIRAATVMSLWIFGLDFSKRLINKLVTLITR
jgi:glycosyltransferase involved in cell wall biosynthesis